MCKSLFLGLVTVNLCLQEMEGSCGRHDVNMRLILAQGQQECTNLAIIPKGQQGLHKWPLKNEGYPSEFTSEYKSDRKLGPVRGIKGRMGRQGHLKDIWKMSFKSDKE